MIIEYQLNHSLECSFHTTKMPMILGSTWSWTFFWVNVTVWTTSFWVAVFENIPFAIETKIHLQNLVHDTIFYNNMDLAPEIIKVGVI